MSSACLPGGGGCGLDLLKSPSSPRSSTSSTSTLSDHNEPNKTVYRIRNGTTNNTLSCESSPNSILTISTKKPRTPRKRPNQTLSEAAAILAKLYPTIFSTTHLCKHYKHHHHHYNFFMDTSPSSDLLPSFRPPDFQFQPKPISSLPKPPLSPPGLDSCSFEEPDFDAQSIVLDEGEGIDSIMGNLTDGEVKINEDYGYYGCLVDPYLGEVKGRINLTCALKRVGGGDWWCSPTVDMRKIVPEKKRKRKKKKIDAEVTKGAGLGLGLKLDYEVIMDEWGGNGSPFPDSPDSPTDIIAKLSDIDLLSEVARTGGTREASILRYKEKKRSRLLPKKVKYQVKKQNVEDKKPKAKKNTRGGIVKKGGGE